MLTHEDYVKYEVWTT